MKPQGGKNRQNGDGGRLGRELFGLFAIFCGLLVALSLATFDSRDPWLNHVVSGVNRVHNKAGLFGAYLSGFLYDIVGFASWLFPAFLCLAGARRILGAQEWPWWRWAGFVLLGLCICLAGAAGDLGAVEIFARGVLPQGAGNVSTHGGGIIGHMLYVGMVGWLSSTGTFLIWLFSLLLAMQMLTGLSLLCLLAAGSRTLRDSVVAKARELMDKRAERREARSALNDGNGRAWEGRVTAPLEVTAYPIAPHTARDCAAGQPAGEPVSLPGPASARMDTDNEKSLADAYEDQPEPASDVQVFPAGAKNETFSEMPSGSGGFVYQSNAGAVAADMHAHSRAPLPHVPEPEKTDAHSLPSFFQTPFEAMRAPSWGLGNKNEEEDLPPWVRDFEQGRVGVPLQEETQRCLSPQTAAAIEALRVAGAADPQRPLFPTGQEAPDPSADPPAFDRADYPYGKKAEGGCTSSGICASAPAAASPLRDEEEIGLEHASDGAVPVFEAPPVEAARHPGMMESLAQRILKPSQTPLPPLDLLQAAAPSGGGASREVLEAKGRTLMTCLNDFGIQGELVGITPGPVVTMFEIRPAPGVRVSRIANLSDDLALTLKAVAVRIQAPVPGTDTVGIEIPNEIRETVCLKELLGSQIFRQSKSLLTLVLGKDIAGIPAVADLATMPHLLVAGATGAGKSVGINSILLSFLYKARPEEVKLLLVDPKRVEMAIYADLPHLVHPVVTEMQLAKNALEWAVAEMEQRYNAIAKVGVRNITDYNARVASWGAHPPPGMEELEFMPYLVIVIDELADLMLVAAKEAETSIVRLAQLARAAGIHLILATQRPSVDVVTGLIKANFPCRISFQVTSKHDSRTILDAVGAEHLLGRGDMLFKPGGGKFQRMHGAFVSDQNVNAVVGYWKSRQRPDYQIDFADWTPENAGGVSSNGGSAGGDIAADPLYGEAVEFVRQQGKASISLIQRKFRIGFNKAARFVEQMEMDGIIGPADGSKPRIVIR